MSLGKHQSVTSDTRLTGSVNYSLHGQPRLAKQVLNSQNCEVEFLRQKNGQLQEKVSRLSAAVADLQINKTALLQLNQKYVKIVNEYYRSRQSGKQNRQQLGNSVLHELEKDHRNLVKHCLNMEEQIKNYTTEMSKFNEMKAHLISVNHTGTKELIDQLRSLTEENRNLKKDNNQLSFELQKSKQECGKLRKGKEKSQQQADLQGSQLERYKSLVNTIQQESAGSRNLYQSKIYELEIKVQKLESQLRREQEYLLKTTNVKRRLEIASVEHVHERDCLKHSLREKRAKSRAVHSASFVC